MGDEKEFWHAHSMVGREAGMTSVWGLVYIASLVLVIWAIVDLARRPASSLPPGRKVLWIVGLVAGWFLFGLVGAIIAVVYLAGYRKRLNAGGY
jgi:cytochrome c oxidase assembly factor CtaG